MNEYLRPDDTRDALRKIGGLLIGLAAAMIYIRKGPLLQHQSGASGPHSRSSSWSRSPPSTCTAASSPGPRRGELRPWQAVHNVFGLIFVPFALTQFVDVIGGNPNAQLNLFWIFAVTAALAFYAGSGPGSASSSCSARSR